MLHSLPYHQYELLEVNFFGLSTPPPPLPNSPPLNYSQTAAYASLFLATKKKTKRAIFEQMNPRKSCVSRQSPFELGSCAAAILGKVSIGDCRHYERFVPHAKKRMPGNMLDWCCIAITFGQYSRNDKQYES